MARKKRTSLHRWLFPGIVFHEFSHYLACLLFGVRIKSVKWFGEDEAYVLHAVPKPVPSLFIALAPFLLGNALAFLLLETAQSQLAAFNPLALLFYWFAVSLAFYSFPSDQDGQNAFENVLKSYRTLFSGPTPLPFKLLAALSFPFVFLPLVFVLGFMALFSNSLAFRVLWTAALVLGAHDSSFLASLSVSLDQALHTLVQLFI